MAGPIGFRLSPSVLEWARTSMGYSVADAAEQGGVSIAQYASWEAGEKRPTYKQLETLAEKVYKRSLAILLLSKPPSEVPVQKDFRNFSNAPVTSLSPDLIWSLRRAKRYQLVLDDIALTDGQFSKFSVTLKGNPVSTAQRFREFINLPIKEQKSWKQDEAFNNFQRKVEAIGIFVFKWKFEIGEARAFCLTGKYPIIVLNANDSKNGRIFSLFHEVCHILFNTNDIFKDFKSDELLNEYKKTEEFCNQFAASFLVPDLYFKNDVNNLVLLERIISDAEISKLANTYNVSNEVIARKLLALNLIAEDFFWSRKHAWDASAKAAKEKENEKRSDSDGGFNQGIKIIFEKGRPYVESVVNAFQEGNISSSDLSNFLDTKLTNLPRILERLG